MQQDVTTEQLDFNAETGFEPDLPTDAVEIRVKLCNLPPVNAIANQVLALTSDPDIHLNQISSVIEADPAFAADILFLANSSLFGFPSRMHSLRHAVAILGLDRIKALAVTVAMRGFLRMRSPLVHQCWRHSVACALICDQVSAIYDVPGDQSFTAGIMHDIGRLGFLKTYPKELTPILASRYQDVNEVLQAERDALNVDHGRAGAWLVNNWALPEIFAEICERHHKPQQPDDSEILQVVRVSCSIADALGFSAVEYSQQPSYREAMAVLAPMLGHNAIPLADEWRASVTARLAIFEN